MGIIKPTKTIPIPDNAFVKGKTVTWSGKNGKKYNGKLTANNRVLVETNTWQIRYRDENGKEIRESIKTKNRNTAAVILAQREKEIERIKMGIATREETISAKSRKESLDELLHKFKQYQSASGATEKHSIAVFGYIQTIFRETGTIYIQSLSRDAVNDWIVAEKQSGKRSFGTINQYVAALNAFLNWAVSTERLVKNPLRGMKKLNVELDRRKKRRALTEDELKRLLSVAQGDFELIYRLLAGIGLRSNELAQATPSQFDFERNRFTVEAVKTKNKKPDVLPVNKELMLRLKQHIEQNHIKNNERLFSYEKWSLLYRLYADLKRAGIERFTEDGRSIDVHSLRKTFGTMLARAGVPLTTTQRLMRHSSPLLTAKLYIDVNEIDLSDAVEKLPTF